jgi:hypothetical protein
LGESETTTKTITAAAIDGSGRPKSATKVATRSAPPINVGDVRVGDRRGLLHG